MYIPDKGDIVSLDFDPSAGKEIMKRRPAYVISQKLFNEHTGFAVLAPITSTVRNMQLEVVLPDEVSTKGAILMHQMKSLDFESREIEFIEKAPVKVIAKVASIVRAIIS
ncbi:MAG: mRNA-degrading endonuclease toxin of MazEF toxin-antitoxin module [Polaribacter sp.]